MFANHSANIKTADQGDSGTTGERAGGLARRHPVSWQSPQGVLDRSRPFQSRWKHRSQDRQRARRHKVKRLDKIDETQPSYVFAPSKSNFHSAYINPSFKRADRTQPTAPTQPVSKRSTNPGTSSRQSSFVALLAETPTRPRPTRTPGSSAPAEERSGRGTKRRGWLTRQRSG